MGPIPLRVPLGAAGPEPAPSTSAWLFAPPPERLTRPATVVFAFPGGGYSKRYFHMEVPGRPGYSMAEHLARHGLIVVACDNFATGESTPPRAAGAVTAESVVEALEATVATTLDRLRAGDLLPSHGRVDPAFVVGLGHSLGAGLVTLAQARRRTFSALVLLGRAVGGTAVPAPPDARHPDGTWRAMAEQHAELAEVAGEGEVLPRQARWTDWQRYLFYWGDVEPDVIAADEALSTTMLLGVAREIGGPDGPNASAARLVDVPLMLAFGERDVSPDPRAEAAAYAAATDVHTFVLPRSGHCHNLAATRRLLWDRIAAWVAMVSAPAAARAA